MAPTEVDRKITCSLRLRVTFQRTQHEFSDSDCAVVNGSQQQPGRTRRVQTATLASCSDGLATRAAAGCPVRASGSVGVHAGPEPLSGVANRGDTPESSWRTTWLKTSRT